jgi:hypothetical protein
MPRTLTQNADTLQQRARFFGYHSRYLGLVRIFLSSNVTSAFVKYVQHETAMRASLLRFQGRPLSEWKRSFLLDPIFRHATRPSVIGIKNVRSVLRNSWLKSRFLHADFDVAVANERVFQEYVEAWTAQFGFSSLPESWLDNRVNSNKHKLIKSVPIEEVLKFIGEMQFPNPKDQSSYLLFELCARNILETGKNLKVDVVLVNDLDKTNLQIRELGADQSLNNIFIGRNPKGAAGSDLIYIGDDKIHTDNTTLHLRFAKIKYPDSQTHFFAPWLSIRVSDDLSTAILEEAE